jgi:hypothetical protein
VVLVVNFFLAVFKNCVIVVWGCVFRFRYEHFGCGVDKRRLTDKEV